VKKSALPLAVILILAGAIVIVVSELMRAGSAEWIDVSESLLTSQQVSAIVAAFAGACLMSSSIRKKQVNKAEETRATASFFPGMNPSLLSGAVPRVRVGLLNQDGRISTTVQVLLYLVCAIAPVFGFIAGSMFLTSTRMDYRVVGRWCSVIGITFMVIGMLLLGMVYLVTNQAN